MATLSKAIETANVRARRSRRSSCRPARSAAPACALPPHRRSSALAPRARRCNVAPIRLTAAVRRRIPPRCAPALPCLSRLGLMAFAPLSRSAAPAAAPALLRPARHGQDEHRAGHRPTAVRAGADQEPRARAQRVGRARHLRRAHQDQGLCGRRRGRAGAGVPEPAVQAADPGRGGRDDGGCAERAAAHHGAAQQGDALLLHLQLRQPHHRPHRQPMRQVPVRCPACAVILS